MWSCTLHFSVVGADKALGNSFGRYLQNGLSLWLCLTLGASLSYLLIFGTYDIRLIFPPCLPPLFAYYNASLSPPVLFSGLSSHRLYIYTQITFVSLGSYLSILLFHWFICLFLKANVGADVVILSKVREQQAYSGIISEMIESFWEFYQ